MGQPERAAGLERGGGEVDDAEPPSDKTCPSSDTSNVALSISSVTLIITWPHDGPWDLEIACVDVTNIGV